MALAVSEFSCCVLTVSIVLSCIHCKHFPESRFDAKHLCSVFCFPACCLQRCVCLVLPSPINSSPEQPMAALFALGSMLQSFCLPLSFQFRRLACWSCLYCCASCHQCFVVFPKSVGLNLFPLCVWFKPAVTVLSHVSFFFSPGRCYSSHCVDLEYLLQVSRSSLKLQSYRQYPMQSLPGFELLYFEFHSSH